MDRRRGARAPVTGRVGARGRPLAVAVVLTVGVLATTATSPPQDPPCPSPSSAQVSGFFGSPELDQGKRRWQPMDDSVRTGPFDGRITAVEVESCVLNHQVDGMTPIDLVISLTDDGSGPDLEAFLRATLVVDGDGRAWTATTLDLKQDGRRRVDEQSVQVARVRFPVAVSIPEPVVLQMPDLDGQQTRDTPVGPLRLTYPSRDPEPAPQVDPQPPLPDTQKWHPRGERP